MSIFSHFHEKSCIFHMRAYNMKNNIWHMSLEQDLKNIPKLPGVYQFFDRK